MIVDIIHSGVAIHFGCNMYCNMSSVGSMECFSSDNQRLNSFDS